MLLDYISMDMPWASAVVTQYILGTLAARPGVGTLKTRDLAAIITTRTLTAQIRTRG